LFQKQLHLQKSINQVKRSVDAWLVAGRLAGRQADRQAGRQAGEHNKKCATSFHARENISQSY
jgi:hypothetical protein